jgi:hypothetical protein
MIDRQRGGWQFFLPINVPGGLPGPVPVPIGLFPSVQSDGQINLIEDLGYEKNTLGTDFGTIFLSGNCHSTKMD